VLGGRTCVVATGTGVDVAAAVQFTGTVAVAVLPFEVAVIVTVWLPVVGGEYVLDATPSVTVTDETGLKLPAPPEALKVTVAPATKAPLLLFTVAKRNTAWPHAGLGWTAERVIVSPAPGVVVTVGVEVAGVPVVVGVTVGVVDGLQVTESVSATLSCVARTVTLS
jgi:hypothetical protein